MRLFSIVRSILGMTPLQADEKHRGSPSEEHNTAEVMPALENVANIDTTIDCSQTQICEETVPLSEADLVIGTADIHIGIDFGTSYTKACFYILDRDERTIVAWKPEWQSRGLPLLPSLLWLDSSDIISMNPPASGIAQEIRYFKMAVAGQLIGRSIFPAQKTRNPPYSLYTAFFLARAIACIEDSIKSKYSFFLRNKKARLSGSMGIPVSYFDSTLNDVFTEILTASRYMQNQISDAEPISRIDELYSASLKTSKDSSFTTVPELYAEAAGLFSDYHTPTGSYALFDIGGGTVDGASVYFSRNDGLPSVNFLTAEVDPLGIEVIANRLVKAGVEATAESARSRLLKPEDQHYPATTQLRHSLQQHTAKVIVPVKKKIPAVWRSVKELPVIVCGGGQSSGWHRSGIRSTYSEFQHDRCNIPRYTLQEISPFGGVFSDIPNDQLHRYMIAIGLSIPQGYGPEILGFPSTNPEIASPHSGESRDLDDIQHELYGD